MASIYFNHAGTSWPKPDCVGQAVQELREADPLEWPERFKAARATINNWFGIADEARLLLTPGCTSALAVAVSDQAWQKGDRVLTSCLEHHALHRPLYKLLDMGVDLEVLPRSDTEPLILEELEARLREGHVRLVALSSASNVTGELLPVSEAIRLAHEHGALVLIDGAQTTGWTDLNIPQTGADMFCFAGHKGPQAPWGVGGLFVARNVCLNSLSARCDVHEESQHQTWHGCTEMPGYCDAGSANLEAIVGMAAATKWLSAPAQAGRLARARRLAARLFDAAKSLSFITVYGPESPAQRMPTVAITHRNRTASEFGTELRQHGIISSYGLQCAPLAHRSLGTGPHGVVRFSCGPGTTESDIDAAIDAIENAE